MSVGLTCDSDTSLQPRPARMPRRLSKSRSTVAWPSVCTTDVRGSHTARACSVVRSSHTAESSRELSGLIAICSPQDPSMRAGKNLTNRPSRPRNASSPDALTVPKEAARLESGAAAHAQGPD